MGQNKEYYAFISYNSEDVEWAIWLQHELEYYHLPSSLNGRKDIPHELRPIFRDIDELSAGNLPEQIKRALENSQNLIVICSPQAASSPWVNQEIETFISLGKTDRIFPFIVEGNSPKDFFPSALLNLPSKEERLGGEVSKSGRDAAFVKIVAGMLNLNFDILWNRYEREKTEKERKEREYKEKLQITQSHYIAEKVNSLIEDGDSYLAKLLAIEALPKSLNYSERPYVTVAETALRNACKHNNTILRGHTNWVNCISCIRETLVSCSSDGNIIMWDINDGTSVKIFTDNEQEISAVYFDGVEIACGTSSGSIFICDINTRNILRKWDTHHSRITSIAIIGGYIVSSSTSCKTVVWDKNTGAFMHSHSGYYFSYNNNVIISIHRSSIEIWDLVTGESYNAIKFDKIQPEPSCVAFNGDIIVIGYRSGCISIWDFESRKMLHNSKCHDLDVTSIVLKGNKIISGSADKLIKIWEIDDCNQLSCLFTLNGHESVITQVLYESNYLISSSRDYNIRLWEPSNFDNGYANIEFDGLGSGCNVCFSENFIISGNSEFSNKSIYVWDLQTKNKIATLRSGPGDPNVIIQNGNYIICGAYKTIKIWDTTTFNLTKLIKVDVGDVKALASDKNIIVAASSNIIYILDEKTGLLINKLVGHSDTINTIVIKENLLFTGSKDKTIRIWDLGTQKCTKVLEGHTESISSIICTNNYLYSGSYDHSIKKWDIYTGKCIKTLYGHTSTVTSIAYSHNYLVTSSGDIIRVWNCLNDECVSIIHAGEHCFGSVHSVAYNGKYIVAGNSCGNCIQIWYYPLLDEIINEINQKFKYRLLTGEEKEKYCL